MTNGKKFVPRARLPAITVAMLAFALGSGNAVAEDYARELAAAVARHQNGAPNATHELAIVEDLAKLSENAQDAWLPDFWAAYLLTQIARGHSEDVETRLERAHRHLKRAHDRATREVVYPAAEFHALRSLIYSFQAGIAADAENKSRLLQARNSELQQTYEADPMSPVAMVMAGTDMMRDGQENGSWPEIMGGLALLHQAEMRFAVNKAPIGLTTNFNREWIDPWIRWAYRMIEGGIDAD